MPRSKRTSSSNEKEGTHRDKEFIPHFLSPSDCRRSKRIKIPSQKIKEILNDITESSSDTEVDVEELVNEAVRECVILYPEREKRERERESTFNVDINIHREGEYNLHQC